MLRLVCGIIALYLTSTAAQAGPPQLPPPTQVDDDIARIVGYSFTRDGGAAFLEKLSDTIPSRITGSPGSREAANFILQTLKDAGFDSAHLEEYDLASSWQHHSISGEVITPVRRQLLIGTYGWVPGTLGTIEVPVVDFGSIRSSDDPIPASVRGAAVITDLRSNASSTTYVGARAIISGCPSAGIGNKLHPDHKRGGYERPNKAEPFAESFHDLRNSIFKHLLQHLFSLLTAKEHSNHITP